MTTTAATPPVPKFEQTMQGLLNLLRSSPPDEPLKASLLSDWLLPLLEDARDEYTAMFTEAGEQLEAVAESLGEEQDDRAERDANARQAVIASLGLASMAFQRAGWLGQDLVLTATCPQDLAGEYTKVTMLVQAWAASVADTAAPADDDDEGGAGAAP